MERLKEFDRALLGKQIGGNSAIVILDTVYFISGVIFGQIHLEALLQYVLFMNMLTTCILYRNFIVSRGELNYELNTEKIIYYPTTRLQFLLNKYAKTLFFLCIQLVITLLCLGLGYYGNMGRMDAIRILASLVVVILGVLVSSGTAILVMHITPLGVYLTMLLYLPLFYGMSYLGKILSQESLITMNAPVILCAMTIVVILLWMASLFAGVKIYEKVN